MMNSALYRMKDEYFWAIVLAAFLSFFLGLVPNYQKYAYKETREIIYLPMAKNDFVGYPAAENFPVVESIADIMSGEHEYFTIVIDVEKLTPMDLYYYFEKGKYSANGFLRVINNNDFGGAGRFFVAELHSGDEVVVLLDDTTIDLPKKGTVRLPIGTNKKVVDEKFRNTLIKKSGLSELDSYIDMAGKWRQCEEAKSLEEKRDNARLLVFIASFIVLAIVFNKLSSEKKKNK